MRLGFPKMAIAEKAWKNWINCISLNRSDLPKSLSKRRSLRINLRRKLFHLSRPFRR